MATMTGLVHSSVLSVGEWLHPATAHRRRSPLDTSVQWRAGVVGLVCMATGVAALVAAFTALAVQGWQPVPKDPAFGAVLLPAAVILVLISVFAPQAVFRTRHAARTREVLANPLTPLQPWSSTTITFDAVLVGSLLAGIYINGLVALALFGAAFVIRILVQSSRGLHSDPNVRFHSIVTAWSAAATGAVAFVIVRPLVGSIDEPAPLAPLIFAALVAMYVGLTINATLRWVNHDTPRWAFLRDALDARRIIVALVSAIIAWLVSVTGIFVDGTDVGGDSVAGTLSGLGIYLAAWLILWYASIRIWHRDALRAMTMWSGHQAEVIGRLADGSLSAELAEKAALPVTARMAISVFGATRALAIVDTGTGTPRQNLVGVDVYDNGPTPDLRSMSSLPQLRIALGPASGKPSHSSVTVAGWLWPGWFMSRSPSIVQRFTSLATETLLVPVIASEDDRASHSFDAMFTEVTRLPNLAAFDQALQRMRAITDASPQSQSLLIGAYSIDDFGALTGGRFDQAAVNQVMRLAMGHQAFAGHDTFFAYEQPGIVWVAVLGGPIIRNQIALLRGLQTHINDRGSVPSARMDVDVHVSVSFGYAAHQVDDFTSDGLMEIARTRLSLDQASRDPFSLDSLRLTDFSPEDIIGTPDTPVQAVDVLALLAEDRADNPSAFTPHITALCNVETGSLVGLSLALGWERSLGSAHLARPDDFRNLIGRRFELAAEGTRASVQALKDLLDELQEAGLGHLPVVLAVPPLLLAPDAAQYALPNLLASRLDRAECARTVILIDTIPPGGGQALHLLADRGVGIAVTAGAAAAADPDELLGWQRWGLVFPQHMMQGANGVDALAVQQTASAIASSKTHLIAVADDNVDLRGLRASNIHWVLDATASSSTLKESVASLGAWQSSDQPLEPGNVD